MTISKITQSNIHPLEQVDKINDIIENGTLHEITSIPYLYAWQPTGNTSASCIYTKTPKPIIGDILYDENGNEWEDTSGVYTSIAITTGCQLNIFTNLDSIGITKYSSTGQVYGGYDRATSHDIYSSNLIDNNGNNINLNKVDKQGDTMTGGLNFNLTNDIKPIIINMDNATGSLNENLQDIDFRLNDTRRAMIRGVHNSGGGNSLQLHIYNDNATDKGGITIATDSSGNPSTTALTPSDNDNSTKIATTAFVKKACDGTYSNTNANVTTNATSLNGSSDLPYTLGLPSDSRNYMVLLSGMAETGSTSGNRVSLCVKSDLATSFVNICGCRTRASNTVNSYGAVWLPVSSSHKIYVQRDSNYNGTFQLWMRGYRRIGVNS